MTISVIGLGAGGHAKVVVEILRADNRYQLAGLLDSDPKRHGKWLLGVSILGNDDELPHLINDGVTHFFVGLGSIGNTKPRQRLYELALSYGLKPVQTIHPQTIISPSVGLGEGITIMPNAVINADVVFGANVIVNTGAIVEHDCVIGDHVHLATGACLASTVQVKSGAHIGAGATIRQCITIGENAVIGAGAAVVKDVPANTVVGGVPAQTLKGG